MTDAKRKTKSKKVPCANCEAKLAAAVKAGEGKTTLGDLNLETTMLMYYFSWAGGRTPSVAPITTEPPADKPAAPEKAEQDDKDKPADTKPADTKPAAAKPADTKPAPAKAPAKPAPKKHR